MKRFLVSILALILLFVLAACGSTDVPIPSAEGAQDGPVQDDFDQNAQQPEAGPADSGNDAVDEGNPQEMAQFEEIVVVDNEYCTIKITGIDPENMWGYTVNAYLENKSADKTFMFSVVSAAINGVDSDPFYASEVAAGKKSNEEITFTTTELEENGVGDFTDIELNFRVYDSSDWSADNVAQATVHIYPYGEENAVHFTREAQPEDTVLVDNEYATVIVTGYEWDDIWGYCANLYIVNKTDTSIMVSVDEASVNGYMADLFYADSVSAGNCAFSTMSWYAEDLKANDITEVETIEFILRVYDDTNWMADFANEVITLNP